MQNIEDVLEIKILECLQYIYNKTDEFQTMLIFFMRCFIYYDSNDLSNSDYINFLLKELNLPEKIVFKGEEVQLIGYSINNLQNVMTSLHYTYLETLYNDAIRGKTTGKELLLYNYKKYTDSAKKMLKCKKKNNPYYEYIYKHILLQNVYDDFNLNIQSYKRFDNFEYPDNHNDFNPTFDELCSRYYIDYIQNEEKLIEKELEDYLFINHLDDIKMVDRQIKIPSGIIDLIGIDKSNKKVLIELKIKSRPVDLLWQLTAYTKDLVEIYKEDIRTIAITPKLEDSILKQIPNEFEIYEFTKKNNKYNFRKVR